MRDIPEYFVEVIRSDSVLQTLMGGTAEDRRIYQYYNADAEMSPEHPAYITYALMATPGEQGGVTEPVYSFFIWARSEDAPLVEAVRDRLVTLFNKKGLTTTAGRKLYGKKVQENDSFQEQPNFAGKTLHFRFGWLSLAAVS